MTATRKTPAKKETKKAPKAETVKQETPKTESAIEKILVDGVKALGGRAYKWVSPGNDGVPDRIVIIPNRAPFFVELKSESGKLTPLQEVQLQRLKDLGQQVRILKGEQEVRLFLGDLRLLLGTGPVQL